MIKLSDLLKPYIDIAITHDCNLHGIALDSREVKPGYLFFAYPGAEKDGRQYISDAMARGAIVVLAEDTQSTISRNQGVLLITMPDLRKKISEMAACFYHDPSKSLRKIGITGTNGKTSCSHFIAASLQSLNIPCGVIGTLGNGLYGHLNTTTLTTPDPITLQKTFADFILEGAKVVAMEVSSHSLDQGRVAGIQFEVGVFTNLTRDHLDYHGSMQAYGDAKRKLFERSHFAVINADDEFGQKLIESLPRENTFAYSTLNKKNAAIFTDAVQLDISGIKATIFSPWGEGEINAPLIGRFNLSNVLAVFTTLCLMGIPFESVRECLSQLTPVPGRMQTLGGGKQPLVIVDYSHTPDALEKVLVALRQHCQGKLYCLFGCGGDRDRGKRPLMAKIAEQYSDYVMVTDDNPRTEDPQQIVNDILSGFENASVIEVQHNRSKAIKDIIQYAHAGDCVLIAGKGAETYQQIGNDKIPFRDVEKARESLLSPLPLTGEGSR
jgi:UDP-N-acetylmuramoyl-L-alanyl-D-glutamate--2,6-diaminopimelate ligase